MIAPRDRAQGPTGDQREEAGAVGEGGEPAEPRESSGGAGIAGRVWSGVDSVVVHRQTDDLVLWFVSRKSRPYLSLS